MAAGHPAPIPSPPAALSPFQPHLNPPRTSFPRFHPLPRLLLAGIELAPLPSLSSIADNLRPALSARWDRLPPRRRLLRLRRTAVDPVHALVELADRRSAAVPVHPSRTATFHPSGRLFRCRRRPRVSRGPPPRFSLSLPSLGRRFAVPMAAAGDHRGAGAPPPAGRADVAAFGRAEWLPRGARPSAARALGCG
ncbi:zinc knuckle containing protein-like [Oryza sativa Japonica Group]|uniref:Zinc knuckle containing protein-like n=1 Tax=Oryza sativa subsp. japonica TaxID=39947 RepID=Q657A5_ORYSJ|nr:zinc knuckle domain-like [Oryza sativa Japonica Group]BAD45120.1 zinc knuckle containing protein-like [Oryza sativa Japonica Group]